ncbi:MAG TPA: beta-propeller fold lactonase family protein [Bryobacteraceae bacterium]|nr:beta-propeller fold lactonase family protein [Bryobacteraceae bacterium]
MPINLSRAGIAVLSIAASFAQQPSSARAKPSLDYIYFKDRVQPILLAKRPGHARCVTCHEHGVPPLVPLAAGAENWTEEQSKQNFEIWKQFVIPGAPEKSKLLLHPLATAAGGDHFHAGGKHWMSQSDPEFVTLAAWVRGESAKAQPAGVVRVLQSNAAGDDIHVIDPETNRVVAKIEEIEVPHGLVIAPDGARIYVTNEALRTLDVVDARTLRVTKRIPLSGRPNNVDVTSDGGRAYVGIRQAPGAVDVIDTRSLTNVKTIATKGEIHNVYVTPDGKYAVAGSIAASTINVIETANDRLSWTLTLSAGIRPMAFTKNADGSTNEIIVQLSNYHGFAVVDFAARKEVRRIDSPDVAGREKETEGLQGSPSHGLAITPDGKMLWATSKHYDAIFAYSLPDYKLLKVIDVGSHPDWLAITPDGKSLYVAVAGDDTTVVVDIQTMMVVKRIPVGSVPKRVTSGILRTH